MAADANGLVAVDRRRAQVGRTGRALALVYRYGCVRAVTTAALCGAFCVSAVDNGLPTEHDRIFLWLVPAVALATVRRWRHVLEIARGWLPFVLLLVLYDWLTGTASVQPMFANVAAQVDVERWLFGTVPTVWLQRHLLSPHAPRWYDFAVMVVYTSYFVVPWLFAAWLWFRCRSGYWLFVRLVCAATGVAYIVFGAYPSMPPWMASYYGYTGHVVRVIPWVWQVTGMRFASTLAESGAGFINVTAAFPSLHATYPAVMVVVGWRYSSRRWRWPVRVALVLYAVAMAFAVVYAGEHFVVDVLAAWLVVSCVAALDRLVIGRLPSPGWPRHLTRRIHDRLAAIAATVSRAEDA